MNCARLKKYNFVHESGTILSNYLLYITFIIYMVIILSPQLQMNWTNPPQKEIPTNKQHLKQTSDNVFGGLTGITVKSC